MDFYKGFHYVPLTYDAARKSAITTERGTFEWTAMPMGGRTGPATFQRVVDTVFKQEIDNDTAAFYLHDILIWGNSWEELARKATIVCARARQHQLKLSAKKNLLWP